MHKLKFLENKIVIFSIQFAILSLFIYLFKYKAQITFDSAITTERKVIIQFLANYILFNNKESKILFIYSIWLIVAVIPILIYRNFKRAYSMNLTTFFFPNFFFYIFLSRYSSHSYDSHFEGFITQTIILGIIIVLYSILLSIIIQKIINPNEDKHLEDMRQIDEKIQSVCPHCGTKFDSIPKFCYNCSKEINLVGVSQL